MGAIVLSQNPSPDAIAAGTALYLGLTKLGKNVSLVCATVANSDLVGADKIQPQLVTSGDSLVVSFPYTDGSIDKVDYNIQGNTFNLTIAPRNGFPKLDPSQVKYSYTGGVLDFIIVLDAPTLQSLGTIYTDNQSQFQGKDIINIDRHLTNALYGSANFVNKTASSVSELVLQLLQELQAEMDKDMATNLYAGIAAATNSLTSYSVNADTFETIANLMRMGAVRKPFRKPGAPQSAQPRPVGFQSQRPPQRSIPIQPTQPIEPEEVPVTMEENNPLEKQQTPQDWLKPKIFRGGGLI